MCLPDVIKKVLFFCKAFTETELIFFPPVLLLWLQEMVCFLFHLQVFTSALFFNYFLNGL